jgi:lipopolysaccharide export system permease protein
MLAEANSRLSAPLYNIAFMAMALAAVIGGAFSRLGYGRRIVAVAAAAAAARILGFGVEALCAGSVWLNLLQYLIPIAMSAWAFRAIFRQRVKRFIALKPLSGITAAFGAGA